MHFERPEQLVAHAEAIVDGTEPPLAPDTLDTLRRELGRFGRLVDGSLLAAFDATLTRADVAQVLTVLRDWGLVRLWLPEVAAMDGLHENAPRHHKDLWAHTLQVLGQTPPEPDLRWVALCHDIGKCATRHFGGGEVSFWRHEGHGAWLFRGIGARFGMPTARIDRIAFVIEHHARTNQFRNDWSDRALRRLMRESGPYLNDMIAFSRSDWSTVRMGRVQAIQAGLDRLETRLQELVAEDARPGLPPGIGDVLLEASGRPPGPWLGEVLRVLRSEMAGDTRSEAPTHPELVARALAILQTMP